MFEVVYYSRSGNTKKVAEAIAVELGVKEENVKISAPTIQKILKMKSLETRDKRLKRLFDQYV